MDNLNIPEGYQRVMPYLILPDAAKFIAFTQKVFEATEKYREMRSETMVRHAEVRLGDCVIMLADSTPEYPPQAAGLFIYVEDADETYQQALSAGAVSLGEPADQPYGRSAGVKDPFGNTWWITSVK